MSGGFQEWFAQQPFTTKWLMVLSISIPVMSGIFPSFISNSVWHLPSICGRLQLWRCITSCFISRLDYNLLMSLFMRMRYSNALETDVFLSHPADYFYFIIFTIIMINLSNLILKQAVLWENLSMAIVHLWAMCNRDQIVTFMFGIKFKAAFLPWVLLGFSFLMSADIYGPLIGIAIGHLYYTIAYVPTNLGTLLKPYITKCPDFIIKLLPELGKKSFSGTGFTAYNPREPKQDVPQSFVPFRGAPQRLGKE